MSVTEGGGPGIDPPPPPNIILYETSAYTCTCIATCNCYNNIIDKCVHDVYRTHRLWLSTVKCSIDVQGPQLSMDVSMVSAELWEYLYRNQAMINHITKPVSVSPVCTVVENYNKK